MTDRHRQALGHQRDTIHLFSVRWILLLVLITAGSPLLRAQEPSAPGFRLEPQSQTVDAGSTASFSVEVTGDPAPTLQWFFNGTALPSEHSRFWVQSNVQSNHAGYYWITASNASGQISSRPVLLGVRPSPPRIPGAPIVQRPQGGASPFLPNQRFEVRCDAYGSAPVSLQWIKDGVAVAGATNIILEIPSLAYGDSGAYSLVASNSLGVAYSSKIMVAVSSLVVVGAGAQVPTNVPAQLQEATTVGMGHYHVLATDSAGRLYAWNSGPNGATNVPANLGPTKAVASSGFNSMALLTSGRVAAWTPSTAPNFAFTNIPSTVTSVVAIANSDTAGLAIRSNGTVVAWGSAVTTGVPLGLSNVVSIAASSLHASALRRDGRVVTWGSLSYTNVPGTLTNAIALSASGSHTLALREDGTVAMWGSSPAYVPPQATNIVAVAAGAMVNLALRADGRLILWGSASNQLAARTARLSNVVAIAASQRSSIYAAIVGDGSPRFTLHPYGQELSTGATIRLHARVTGQQPMSYQWIRNGQPIPGAVSPTLVLDQQAGANPGLYQLIASNALGSAASTAAPITSRFVGTLGQALNAPQATWRTYLSLFQEEPSTNAWFAQSNESFDGQGAAQSGPVAHGRGVSMQTWVQGPGQVAFRWKVSSEEGYDWLAFTNRSSVSGITRQTGTRISGERTWALETVDLAPGRNDLSWTYYKDSSASVGSDAGWVDTVTFIPAAPAITRHPPAINTYPGRTELIGLAASSMTPITCIWYFNEVPIPGANALTNLFQGTAVFSTNTYRVVVINSTGQASTEKLPFVVRPTPTLGAPAKSPDGLRLRLAWPDSTPMSHNDQRFHLQTSTNLLDWERLWWTGSITNGALDFLDHRWSEYPERFYRLEP